MRSLRLILPTIICTLLGGALSSALAGQAGATDKIPITTSSPEARDLYLKGRDLAERLRATDGRRFYEQAVGKDADFALAHVGLANTAGTTKEFIDAVTRAAALAGRVSEGEKHMVLGLDAAMKGNPAEVLGHYKELVRLFPNDERAHTLLGNLYFGRQEYDAAVKEFVRATAITPSFSQPYNQLGYAYRFLDKLDDAEVAFKKYVQLIPDDPNPHDSYAELLMKRGRFAESIKAYEKALSLDPNFVASYVGIGNNYLCEGRTDLDPNFVASYVGIGNNYLCEGRTDQARTAFARIAAVARNTGEQRLAHFWTAAAYVYEGATDKALGELRAGYALAEAERDSASMSGDLVQMGDVLREARRFDDASAKYAEAIKVIDQSGVPQQVKDATRRNHVFEEARLAVAKGDLAAARTGTEKYATLIAARKAPFEVRQLHELRGSIALADKRGAEAVQELTQANQQDPRILYLTAQAYRESGNTGQAAAFAKKAARFNGLAFNYAYVRNKAATLVGPATE